MGLWFKFKFKNIYGLKCKSFKFKYFNWYR